MKKFIFFLLTFPLLLSCRSQSTRPDAAKIDQGQWRAKALIRDLVAKRSHVVYLDVNWQRQNALRMDVTSGLGTGVASLIINQKLVKYVIFSEKKFYSGSPQPQAMRPILALPVDPRWLENIFLAEPIREKNWSCTGGAHGAAQECRELSTGLVVTWPSATDRQVVKLIHDKASVQIQIQSFRSKVEGRAGLFQLEAPKGYEQIRVD